MKTTHRIGEEFERHIFVKGLVSILHKECIYLKIKKTNNQVKNEQGV